MSGQEGVPVGSAGQLFYNVAAGPLPTGAAPAVKVGINKWERMIQLDMQPAQVYISSTLLGRDNPLIRVDLKLYVYMLVRAESASSKVNSVLLYLQELGHLQGSNWWSVEFHFDQVLRISDTIISYYLNTWTR